MAETEVVQAVQVQPQAPAQVVPPAKPGWKTTEFWGKNIVQLITIASAAYAIYSGNQLTAEQQTKIAIAAAAVLGWVESKYSESRGLSKGGS